MRFFPTMDKRKVRRPARLLGVLSLACAGLASAPASATDFYHGKTISFVVGTGPSGGYNIYAHIIAPYLTKYIPGNPAVIVKNMPGAGSATAAAYMQRVAPRDGTVIASLQANPIMGKLIDPKANDKFDPAKFIYLAGAEHGTRVCMAYHTAKVKTYADALKQKIIIGGTSSGAPTLDYAYMHQRASGVKFDIVSGYAGPGSLFLAMERGEIEGTCGLDWNSLKAQKPDWLRDKKLNILVQDGLDSVAELNAMGVPQPWAFIKDPETLAAVKLIVGFQQAFGKSYLTPPDVPDAQIKILRDAFDAALHDKQLIADANKVSLDVVPSRGEAVQKVIENLFSTPPAVVARVKTLLAP